MGGTLAKLSVSALLFDYILTAPISAVSAGQLKTMKITSFMVVILNVWCLVTIAHNGAQFGKHRCSFDEGHQRSNPKCRVPQYLGPCKCLSPGTALLERAAVLGVLLMCSRRASINRRSCLVIRTTALEARFVSRTKSSSS